MTVNEFAMFISKYVSILGIVNLKEDIESGLYISQFDGSVTHLMLA